MAHFYGTVQGNKGETSRIGSKNSGITAKAYGWDLGGTVVTEFNKHLNTDVVTFYTTRDNDGLSKRVASFAVVDDNLKLIDTEYPEVLI